MNWFSFESMFSKIRLSTHLFLLKTRSVLEEFERYFFLYLKKPNKTTTKPMHLWDRLSEVFRSSGLPLYSPWSCLSDDVSV